MLSTMGICRLCLVWLLGSALLAFGQASASTAQTIESIKAMLQAHQIDRALQSLRSSIQASPGNSNLWTLDGIALSLKGDITNASAAFERALHLAPDNLAALRGEAQILDHQQDQRAVPLLHHILELSPGDPVAHEMLAVYEQKSGHCSAAIADFRKSGATMGEHPQSLIGYGSCLESTGQLQQAISVFKKLVTHFPQLHFAKYDLALVFYDAGNYKQTIKVLKPLIHNGEADSDTLSLASEAYEATDNTPQAVGTLRQAIVKYPKNVNLYNYFAELCLDHKSYNAGISMVSAGISYNPRAPSLYIARGVLYAELAKFADAESDFAAAQRLNPKQGTSAFAADMTVLEKYHFDAGHFAATVKALRAQVQSHPDNFLLHYLLAKLFTMEGGHVRVSRLKRAQAEAAAAIRLKPSFVVGRDLLARIDLDLNDFSAAAEQSRIALHEDANDHAAAYHLIRALRHSERPQDRAELNQTVERLRAMENHSFHSDIQKKHFHITDTQSEPAK